METFEEVDRALAERECEGKIKILTEEGSDKIIERLKEKLGIESNEITKDGLFTLRDVRCIGACGMAPVMMIDDKVYGRVKQEDIDGIIDSYRDNAAYSEMPING